MKETRRGVQRRQEIMRFMRESRDRMGLFPTVREIARAIYGSDASYTSTQHHLKRLIREGKIIDTTGARGLELPSDAEPVGIELDLGDVTLNRSMTKIVGFLASVYPRPASYREISRSCGLSVGTVYKYVTQLAKAGIVDQHRHRTRAVIISSSRVRESSPIRQRQST